MYATNLTAIHLIKTQVSTPWRCLRITKVSRVHPLGAMSVCMQCQGNTSKRCSDIPVRTKVVDRQINIATATAT